MDRAFSHTPRARRRLRRTLRLDRLRLHRRCSSPRSPSRSRCGSGSPAATSRTSRRTATRCRPRSPTAIGLAAHRKAADYTVARTRLGVAETLVEAAVLLALTLGGGLAALVAWTDVLPLGGRRPRSRADRRGRGDLRSRRPAVLVSCRPSASRRNSASTGRRARSGSTDLAKGILIGAALGLPLAALVLWLMRAAGPLWWIWAWVVWIAFQFLLLALYPTVIAPLFNKFSPLPAGAARDAIEALLARCGFANRGLFVMDGSRRSSHGNAFFTGFGRAQAHRVLRHAARAARAGRDRGGARARARPLQAAGTC